MLQRLMHISDLHFGRLHAPALNALKAYIKLYKPDAIVVTGDWTQRARVSQFKQARAFLTELQVPVVSVPGNHDIPLYNIWLRLLSPFRRYERYISAHSSTTLTLPGLSVIGICSVNIFVPVAGKAHAHELRRARLFYEANPGLRILAMHHPFSLAELGDLPVDVILTGHCHESKVEWLTHGHGRRSLHVSAGTSVSTRLRSEVNSFHSLNFHDTKVDISTFQLSDEGFAATSDSFKTFTFS